MAPRVNRDTFEFDRDGAGWANSTPEAWRARGGLDGTDSVRRFPGLFTAGNTVESL